MRIAAAVFLLMIGLALPLLLDGQTFTNSLLGLSCGLGAVAVALGPARDPRASAARRLVGRIVAVLSIVLAAGLAGQLRSAYQFQAEFNRRRQEIRRAAHGDEALLHSAGGAQQVSSAAGEHAEQDGPAQGRP